MLHSSKGQGLSPDLYPKRPVPAQSLLLAHINGIHHYILNHNFTNSLKPLLKELSKKKKIQVK